FLAFGDVDRGADHADDLVGFIAQRIDVNVVPTNAGAVADGHFGGLRPAIRQNFVFQRGKRGPRLLGKKVRVGVTENVLDGVARQRIADRGVAQVAVLRRNSDV